MIRFGPVRVVASRAVHHKTVKYVLGPPILPLFEPSHLNGFQFFLVRILWIVAETFKADHPLVQIRESDAQRIGIGKLVGQSNGDVFGCGPRQGSIHFRFPLRVCLSTPLQLLSS